MTKKTVIVPKHAWTVVKELGDERIGCSATFLYHRGSRQKARYSNKFIGGAVRKVTKIVYYYE